jgi:hypothetical protein
MLPTAASTDPTAPLPLAMIHDPMIESGAKINNQPSNPARPVATTAITATTHEPSASPICGATARGVSFQGRNGVGTETGS